MTNFSYAIDVEQLQEAVWRDSMKKGKTLKELFDDERNEGDITYAQYYNICKKGEITGMKSFKCLKNRYPFLFTDI